MKVILIPWIIILIQVWDRGHQIINLMIWQSPVKFAVENAKMKKIRVDLVNNNSSTKSIGNFMDK